MTGMFFRLLRDPLWQAVGALATLVAFFVTWGPATNKSELAVVHTQQVKFRNYDLPASKIKFLIEGLPSDLEMVDVDYFEFKNRGSQPIRASDFVAPLSIQQSSGTKRIILVEPCRSEVERVCSIDGAGFAPMSWRKEDKRWTAALSLLNPGESGCAVVISERHPIAQNLDLMRFAWNGRIVNLRLSIYESLADYEASLERTALDHFRTLVVLQDMGVYWFLLLQGLSFLVLVSLSVQAKWLPQQGAWFFGKLLIMSLFSMAAAELLVSAVFNGQQQAPIAWVMLSGYIVLCSFLTVHVFKQRRRKIDSAKAIDDTAEQ